MLRTKSIRMGILLMSLVVGLAAIGTASALWSKSLAVGGSVATGTVDVAFTDAGTYHNQAYPINGLKDVGSCTVGGGLNADWVTFNVLNGYPGYECWAVAEVTNIGTIPVHVYQPDLTTDAGPAEVTIEVIQAPVTLPDNTVIPACFANDTQLHAGDVAYCSLFIRVEQGALQGHTYTFDATIEGRQYNEPRP